MAIDPPDHVRYRRILDPMFAPKVIGGMEADLRLQAREIITSFASNGECDIVSDLARIYPTQVFLTLFGMPLSDRDTFIHWTETVVENSKVTSTEPSPEAAAAAAELFAYLQHCVDAKRANPGDDVLSRLLSFTGDDEWSNEEILGLCFLFILAGLDTVTAMIGFLFLHLARRGDVRRRVVEQPGLLKPVIEEVLRLEPPVPVVPRVTTRNVEVCGTSIPAGSLVSLCLGAVNRDPDRCPSADELDPDLADTGHRAFGGGIHRCIGSHLARRELSIVAEEFHKVIPDYELSPGVDPEMVWPAGTFHLDTLKLVFPVASGE